MSTIIPDGVYKFMNTKYPQYAADLLDGLPWTSVGGYIENNRSDNQKWRVRNLGSNQVILENVAVPNIYASAPVCSNSVPITGTYNPTVWSVHWIAEDRYQFATLDGKHVWVLPEKGDYVAIILRRIGEIPITDTSYWMVRRA